MERTQGDPCHLPFVPKPKGLDYSCWCPSQQREFSAVSRPRPQNHHAVEGRAPCLGLTPPQAEPHLPSKASGDPTCPQASQTGRAAPPGGSAWMRLQESKQSLAWLHSQRGRGSSGLRTLGDWRGGDSAWSAFHRPPLRALSVMVGNWTPQTCPTGKGGLMQPLISTCMWLYAWSF